MMRTSLRGAALLAGAFFLIATGERAMAQDDEVDAAAAAPAVLASFITAGQPDSAGKVPALNVVPGANVPTLSVAQPQVILHHGLVYTYALVSENNTFTGTCSDSYSLVRGKTVLAKGTIKSSYACKANTYWDWAANGTAIPNKPGLAKLVGTVTYGGGKTVTTSVQVLIK